LSEPVAPVWREPALAGVVVAVLWVLLAAWEPMTTWHLAPFLVGALPPWLLSRQAGPPHGGLPLVRRVAAISGAAAAGLAVALWALGVLRGPVLTGSGPAVVESVVLGVLGAGRGIIRCGKLWCCSLSGASDESAVGVSSANEAQPDWQVLDEGSGYDHGV